MKKYCLLVMYALLSNVIMAQCTPDLSIVYNGVYPKTLPNGTEGELYSQVMQFKIPKDTLSLTVDSLYILSVVGGPATINVQCNKPGCAYKGNTIGCAVLTCNVPAGSAGNYSIDVTVKVKLKSGIPFVPPVYQTFTNSLDLTIDQAVGVKDLWALWKDGRMQVTPNPFNETTTLKFISLKKQTAALKVYDLTGQLKMQQNLELTAGLNQTVLNLQQLNTGVYILMLAIDEKTFHTKIVRAD